VIAPRASHAKLYINKKLFSVMSFVEAVDDQFTEVRPYSLDESLVILLTLPRLLIQLSFTCPY
jgi:hypothetical protein